MTKTINLPLYQTPNGSVVDLRAVLEVEAALGLKYDNVKGDMEFRVHYKDGMEDAFVGEGKWLELQREDFVENWNKVVSRER